MMYEEREGPESSGTFLGGSRLGGFISVFLDEISAMSVMGR